MSNVFLHNAREAEKAEKARLRARVARIYRAIPEGTRSERLARAYAIGARGARDGIQGVARKLTSAIRDESAPAVTWADRPDLTGELVKNRAKASGSLARNQAKIRASIANSDGTADACKAYAMLRERYVPGGSYFNRCTSRAMRRAMRATVHTSDMLASKGDWHGACEVLRGE